VLKNDSGHPLNWQQSTPRLNLRLLDAAQLLQGEFSLVRAD
jgi:hypothetical protein